MIEKTETKHFDSIDILRGLASFMVAYFHFTVGVRNFLNDNNILKITGHFGWAGVEMFFVISGFVIPYSMYRSNYKIKNIKSFLIRRIARIDPPYLISIILVLIFQFLSTLNPYYRGNSFAIDWISLVLHLGYLNAFFEYNWLNPVYWTLAIEFQYYIIIALILPFIIHKNKFINYITIILFAFLGYLFPSSTFIFHYSLLFILGILLFYYKFNFMKKNEFYIISTIILYLIFYKLGYIVFLSAFIAYLVIFLVDNNKNKILKFGGKISYSLYLIHVPIGGRIINLADHFIENEIYKSIAVFFAMALSIFASWIFYKLIENPSIDLSKKIKY
ncbi:MAG: acyltransferase [Bacteroidales bacterium]|nr:acyltransferase [Bacteroidales bacterium]MBN2757664.1 acyltransferase [Bacteroidales bacterium]